MANSHIIVAGGTSVDLLVYPSLDPRGQQKFGVHRCHGGATLIADLLSTSKNEHKLQVHKPTFEIPKDSFLEQSSSSIAELEVFGEVVTLPLSFKVKRKQ